MQFIRSLIVTTNTVVIVFTNFVNTLLIEATMSNNSSSTEGSAEYANHVTNFTNSSYSYFGKFTLAIHITTVQILCVISISIVAIGMYLVNLSLHE